MGFLRNCWYVAAWGEEVADSPFERRILGQSILIFRLRDGSPVALSNRCPHRFAPLHLGKLADDQIQCPYHGLVFNSKGRCVHNPQSQRATPAAAQLREFPLHERYGALWIWMGEPGLADPGQIPDMPFLELESGLARVQGYLRTAANYELMTDNIIDLSHVDYLHPTSLGCQATAKAETTVRREGDTVYCERWMPNERQGPLPEFLFDRQGNVDAWLDVRWDPPSMLALTFGMTDVGSPRSAGRQIPNVHFMTPETETSTHYFWATCRDFRTGDAVLSAVVQQGAAAAFSLEDGPMIEAQQAMMGTTDLWSLHPVILQSDAAAVLARRILQRLIANEAGEPTGEANREPTAGVPLER